MDVARNVVSTAYNLSRFGEVVAGSPKEHMLLDTIKGFVEGYSDEIRFEPVSVTTWHEDFCYIEIAGKRYRCALQPPYQGYVDIELSPRNTIVLGDPEKAFVKRMDFRDRVVIVDEPKDLDDLAVVANALASTNPLAIIFSNRFNTIRRIVVLDKLVALYEESEPLKIPVISVPRDLIEKAVSGCGRVVAKAKTFSSYGYNIIASSHGGRDKEVYITAHHDHWLSGASDNVV